MENQSSENKKVHLVSLGCSRNRVDSEVMLGSLFERGWESTDEAEQADAIVVNTCGFIQSAKEESIDRILEAGELKKSKDLKLVVTGCLTQRYKRQLAEGMPEVDLFIGTDEFTKIADLIEQDSTEDRVHTKRTNYLYNENIPRVNTLTKSSAYVKVAEGCQHNCAFCIIPAIRGRLRSRPIESVVKEVKKLVSEGVKEVNLIAQDLAAFGRDKGTDELVPLLKELVKIEKLDWVRLLYVYPENISEEFLEVFATEDKIVKYLDIPVQHGSDDVLSRMNRDVNSKQIKDTIAKLRSRVPDVSIRTSVMVGFPGETDQEFAELKKFVEDVKFDHLGCFTYSIEEGTVAGRMKDQIDEEVKVERQAQIMEVQKEISKNSLTSMVGKIVPVLVKGLSEESELLYEGRLSTQAPEVDGVVYVNDGPVKAGEIQLVEITEAFEYDLVGRVLEADELN
jgi:ribosomal protein S12 methylthiotransferase